MLERKVFGLVVLVGIFAGIVGMRPCRRYRLGVDSSLWRKISRS